MSDDVQLVVIAWYNALGLRRIRFNDENVPTSSIVALKRFLFDEGSESTGDKTKFSDVLDWIHETYRYSKEADGMYQRPSDVFRTMLDGGEASVQRDYACVLLILLLSAAVIRNKNNQQTTRVKTALASLPAAQSALIVNVINGALCDSDRHLMRVTSNTIGLILDAKLPADAHAQLVASLKQTADENGNDFATHAVVSSESVGGVASTPIRPIKQAEKADVTRDRSQTDSSVVTNPNANGDAAMKHGSQSKRSSLRGTISSSSIIRVNDSLSDSELACTAFRTPERRVSRLQVEYVPQSAYFTQPATRNTVERSGIDNRRLPGASAQRFALRKRLRDNLAVSASVHSPIEQEKYQRLRIDFERQKEEHEKALRVMRKERDELRAHLSELNDELETKNDALLKAQNENALIASQLTELSRYRDTQEELTNVTQRLLSAQQKIRHLEHALDKERAETVEFRELRIEYEQVTAREKQANSARAQLEDRIAQLESQLSTQRADCERKQKRVEKYRDQLREKHEQLLAVNTTVSEMRLQLAEHERARRLSIAPTRTRHSHAPSNQPLSLPAQRTDSAKPDDLGPLDAGVGTLTNNSLNDSVDQERRTSLQPGANWMRVVNPSLDESAMSTLLVGSTQRLCDDPMNESSSALHEPAGESLGCVVELRIHELEAQLEALQASSVPLERFLELESKMRVAEQNLRVVNEQLEDGLARESQLKIDYEALKRQSEFAAEEHRLRLETVEQALAAAHRQHDAVVKRRTELECRVDALVAANEQVERERAADHEAARAQNAKRIEEIDTLRHAAVEKDETIRRLETQLGTTRSRLNFAESELDSIRSEYDTAKREFDRRLAELDATRSKLTDRFLEEAQEDKLKVTRAELQLARFEVETKERELEALRADLNAYWGQLIERNEAQKRLSVDNDALKNQIASLTEQLANSVGTNRELKTRCDDAECDLLAARKLVDLSREQLENEQATARVASEQLATATNELKAKTARVTALERELDAQRSCVAEASQSFENERNALNTVRSALLRDITDLQSALAVRDERIAELQRGVSDWDAKLAAAQRELLDALADNAALSDALAATNTQLERARLQHSAALSELGAIRARADQLESAARSAREELDAARLKHREELDALSARVAEQVRDLGVRQEAERAQLDARRNEELVAARERARAELDELETRFEETLTALHSRNTEYEALRRACNSQADELAELRSRLLDRDAEVARIESTNATLKALLEDKAAILEEKEATYSEIRAQLGRIQTERDDALRRRVNELETEIAALKRRDAERLQLEAELGTVKRNATLEIAQLRRVEEENVQLKASVNELRRSNIELERANLQLDDARRAQLDSIVGDLRTQHETALSKANEEVTRLAAELESAREHAVRLYEEVESGRKQVQQERSQFERVSTDLRNEAAIRNEYKNKWDAAVRETETLRFELERCRADLTDAKLRLTLSAQPSANVQNEAALRAEWKAKVDAAMNEMETLRTELERCRNELVNAQLLAAQNTLPSNALQNESALKAEYKSRWEAAMRDAETLKAELERCRAQLRDAEVRIAIGQQSILPSTVPAPTVTRRTSLDEVAIETRVQGVRSPHESSATRLSGRLEMQETNLDEASNSTSSLVSVSASSRVSEALSAARLAALPLPANFERALPSDAPLPSSTSSFTSLPSAGANGSMSGLNGSSATQRSGPKLQLCLGCEDEEADGVEPRRLSELYRRNQGMLPHMRSCYPVETQAAIAPVGAALEPPTSETRKIMRYHYGAPLQPSAAQSFASSTVLGQPFSTPARDAGLLHVDAMLPPDARHVPQNGSLSATPSIEPAGKSSGKQQFSVAEAIKWELPNDPVSDRRQSSADAFKVPPAPSNGLSSRGALQPQNDNVASSNHTVNASLRFEIPMSSGKQRKPPRIARVNNGGENRN